jgi:glycosyltransferase involved in cell wall biosynthesis
LRRLAAGTAVEFLGWKTDQDIRRLYQSAGVVLLPGTEDFGIVTVEAQACGTPVVARAEGGACETVVPGVTGELVAGRDPAMFADAIRLMIDAPPDRDVIRRHAERFSVAHFKAGFAAAVDHTGASAAAAS